MFKTGQRFKWARYGGYEISSQGDKRFSAFNAILSDGRSIEQWYQCDVKGYQPGGTDWRLGKGKPPIDSEIDLWEAYLSLWREWLETVDDELIQELMQGAASFNMTLSDRFATTPVNQAHALSVLLNEILDSSA